MDHPILLHLRESVAEHQWSYRKNGPNASEPAALAAVALCAWGLPDEALRIGDWLRQIQTSQGSVGVTAEEQEPAWPTSLATLAWLALETAGFEEFIPCCQQAVEWMLETKGKPLPRRRQIGHDTTIPGWSWAENTHSWLEPTCFCTLALHAAGFGQHQRTRDGISMIVDRLHLSGGCNFGNTFVLGQSTLPHVQPTGIAMLALGNAQVEDPRISRSLDYLQKSLADDTATASLCFAAIGLQAHGRAPAKMSGLIEQAFVRDRSTNSLSCYKLALLSIAALENKMWLPEKLT